MAEVGKRLQHRGSSQRKTLIKILKSRQGLDYKSEGNCYGSRSKLYLLSLSLSPFKLVTHEMFISPFLKL